MFLLPFDEFVIESPLLEEEIKIQLEKRVEPEVLIRSFNPNEPYKMFEGNIEGNEFTIRRIVKAALFVPVIKGRIEHRNGVTRITVRMRIGFFVLGVIISFIALLYLNTASLPRGHADVSFSAIGLLCCYAVTMIIYVSELNTAKEELLGMTKGKLIADS